MSKTSKTLRCSQCDGKFSEQDVEDLKFFASTNICRKCYIEAQQDRSICFGKKSRYALSQPVCNSICPDRKICKYFIRVEALSVKKVA